MIVRPAALRICDIPRAGACVTPSKTAHIPPARLSPSISVVHASPGKHLARIANGRRASRFSAPRAVHTRRPATASARSFAVAARASLNQ